MNCPHSHAPTATPPFGVTSRSFLARITGVCRSDRARQAPRVRTQLTVTAFFVVFAVALSGCLVVPKIKTSRTIVSTHTKKMLPRINGAMRVEVESQDGMVQVEATRPALCREKRADVVRISKKPHAKVVTIGDGTQWQGTEGTLILLVYPVVAAATLLATGLALVGGTTSTTRALPARIVELPCDLPEAGVAVAVGLPSGAALRLVTDKRGKARASIPKSEPASGVLLVDTGGLLPGRVPYESLPEIGEVMTADLAAGNDALGACRAELGLASADAFLAQVGVRKARSSSRHLPRPLPDHAQPCRSLVSLPAIW